MKAKPKIKPLKRVIFPCDCGHPAYLDFIAGDDGELYIRLTDEPRDLWASIKSLWSVHKVWYGEVILWKRDIQKLRQFLTKL